MIEAIFKSLSSFGTSIISLFKVMVRSKMFFRSHSIKGDSIFLLGNGPSLNDVFKEHQNELQKRNLLCVNGFSSTEYFEVLKPKYFIFNAVEIWSGQATNPKHIAIRDKMVNDLIEKTQWELVLFLPFSSRKNKEFTNKIQSNKNITISYFNNTPVEGSASIIHHFFKWGWGSPRAHNVIIPSIMLALNSKVKNIFLLGVDHSWLPLITVNSNNETLINQKHFYDENSSEYEQMSKKGKKGKSLHEVLEKFYYSFRSYIILEEYAQKLDKKVFNCTEGSFIDAFERLDIEIALEQSKT